MLKLHQGRDIMNDTIASISTALGVGAISIIRISGPEAISIVNRIYKGKNLENAKSHTIHYGHIISNNQIIDEVLVSIMKSPRTYTKEDVVEINCHGGIATTNKILSLLLENGARLAEPGEFTKRAFLNGRIDLIEAEGIMNLIEAQTEETRSLSINQLSGKVSSLIRNLRNDLIQMISQIEVNIDYPEYEDIEHLTNSTILPSLLKFKEKLTEIISKSQTGKLLNEGIRVSIIGRPNVGKSSLLNQLLEEEKAIVTDIPGTTRDIVEGRINLDGLLLHIIDTAGIRETKDQVEKIGVHKSLSMIDQSDLVLLVLNNNEPLQEEDTILLQKIQKKPYIIVINKIDLQSRLKIDDPNIVRLSAKTGENLETLSHKIKELFHMEKIASSDFTYFSNARSISLLKKADKKIEDALELINHSSPIDMVELEIRESWNLLGEIIGETYQEELLDELFSRFCLGK